MDHTANMLGALSLTLSTRVWESVNAEFGSSGEIGAAVVVLGVEPLSIDALRQALGITHSGGVRLVDRLVDDGLVVRVPNPEDKRGVLVTLTDEGRTRRFRALRDRAAVLEPVLTSLDAAERTVVRTALEKILRSVVVSPAVGMQVCRLCDEDSCVPRGCPVEQRCLELEARQ